NNGVIDKEQLPKIKDTIKNNKNLVSVMTSPILVTLFHVCYPFPCGFGEPPSILVSNSNNE
ncbi:hypothetical protein MJN85_33020, partial [Salmonella enterica subsp. enterica serovar Anatum]|nr:hypothetical protein [Salmonella enterica subsp. enterica serovar Anatum]